MKITILTIAPEMFGGLQTNHVIDRAVRGGRLEIEIKDIRSYADGCFRKVDDTPYGGGAGLILRCQPVIDALKDALHHTQGDISSSSGTISAAFAPFGERYTQETARRYSLCGHLILICGHYEGMDARIYPYADEVISVGDYILSGGETAAYTVLDTVARLLPGTVRAESLREETFEGGLVEYPQYTRPAEYDGQRVPDVLLSGNHEAIREWKREQALQMTRKHRPDLLDA
ncbi:MAG: tRNA (guanosine(37)-N1)-methyltransferase TrmD [Lachnospiraceae bacterium]|nr:tRNA (guanosine(37)-N1)-methyltransferase TrmD [Lachnospiraceae bacterium]